MDVRKVRSVLRPLGHSLSSSLHLSNRLFSAASGKDPLSNDFMRNALHGNEANAYISELFNKLDFPPVETPFVKPEGIEETPLVPFLQNNIVMRGPLSVADYMRSCLGNPLHGYYKRRDREVFGTGGDFVTSPEISTLFGEVLASWVLQTRSDLISQGKMSEDEDFIIIECGPGKGTLAQDMKDLISRLSTRLPKKIPLKSIHLVETSTYLRKVQAATLKATDIEFTANNQPEPGAPQRPSKALTLFGKEQISVQWSDTLEEVPRGIVSFVIAQELFDALPTHQLYWKPSVKAWRERLVDVNSTTVDIPKRGIEDFPPKPKNKPELDNFELPTPTSEAPSIDYPTTNARPFTFARAPGSTIAAVAFQLHEGNMRASGEGRYKEKKSYADVVFDMVDAHNAGSPYVDSALYEFGPIDEDRVRKETEEQSSTQPVAAVNPLVDSTGRKLSLRELGAPDEPEKEHYAEYSPDAVRFAREIAIRVGEDRGAALIIDYGQDVISKWTLRGIRGHKFVDPLEAPGEVDLSVDVDFSTIRTIAEDTGVCEVFGPITQGAFLTRCGIIQMRDSVLGKLTDPKLKENVSKAVDRLISPNEMGRVYKVMSFIGTGGKAIHVDINDPDRTPRFPFPRPAPYSAYAPMAFNAVDIDAN